MLQPPRPTTQTILSLNSIWHILLVGSLMIGSGFGIFHYEYNMAGVNLMVARCAVVNMLIAAEYACLFTCRKLYAHDWKIHYIFQNKAIITTVIMIILLQILFIYIPGIEYFFEVKPIDLNAWLHIFIVATGIFITVEFKKFLMLGLFKTY